MTKYSHYYGWKISLKNTLSIKHLLNRFRLICSFLKRDICSKGTPNLLHVEVTNRCNLSCKMCGRTINQLTDLSDLSFNQFKGIADQAANMYVEMVILHSWGEPLLNSDLIKIIQYATRKGLPTWLSTNSTLLDFKMSKKLLESGLSGIVFSIDGATKETYEKIRRGANFNKVVKNIKQFIKLKELMKASTLCTVQLIEMPENKHEVEAFKTMWSGKNVNVLVKPLVKWENANNSHRDDKFICDKPWFWMKLHSDFKYYPCGHDFEKKYMLGDADKENIVEIWNGEKYSEFRSQMCKDWNEIEICRKCDYAPPRKRNILSNIGFVLFDVFTLTKLLFKFGYKK